MVDQISPEFGDYARTAIQAIDDCLDPQANVLDIMNMTELIDLNQYLDQYVSEADIQQAIASFDFSTLYDDLSFTGGVDFTTYLSDSDDIIADAQNALQVFGQLVEANQSAGEALATRVSKLQQEDLLTCVVLGTSTQAEALDELLALGNRIDLLNARTDQILDVDHAAATTQLGVLVAQYEIIKAEILGLAQFEQDVIAHMNALTTHTVDTLANDVVPAIMQDITQLVNTVEGSLWYLTGCYWVGQDLNAARNTLCVSMVGSLDGVWWTAGAIGFSFAIYVIGAFLAERRCIGGNADESKSGGESYEMY